MSHAHPPGTADPRAYQKLAGVYRDELTDPNISEEEIIAQLAPAPVEASASSLAAAGTSHG